ncbi:methylenetetrahydrofolate reductase [Gordonia terrae]|uniref:methylenetetrahydrofolate reductase n=1 Tax=Gordonia terrae TaxID=2055 RepID=UPI003F6A60C8
MTPYSAADNPFTRDALRDAVQSAPVEIIPFTSTGDAVLEHVPRSVRLTVTASPGRGQDATIDLAERLSHAGYAVTPHLSARLIRDRGHLADILSRCRDSEITSAFVIGGDATDTATSFADALALLTAIHDGSSPFTDIGIGGHPEGIPGVDDAVLMNALSAKAILADHITTQICFNPGTTVAWAARLRDSGIDLPILVGVPGAVRRKKLLRISATLGLGESTRFLTKQQSLLYRFFRPGGYRPDHILSRIGPVLGDPRYGLAGIHIFSFNDLDQTIAWRQRTLSTSTETP